MSMRPFLEAVWADRDALVATVARQVATLPTYASSPSSEVWIGMTRILERVVSGDPFAPPTDADRQAAMGTGVQGGRAGIAVDDLIAAVLLGAREVEAEILRRAQTAGVAEGVRWEASLRARKWAEQVVVWAVQGLASTTGAETADARHRRLLDAMQRNDASVALADVLADAGLDPGAQHVVACAVPDGTPGSDVAATALRFAHRGRAAWAEESTAGETLGVLSEAPERVPGLVVALAWATRSEDLPSALREARRVARVAAARVGEGLHTAESLGLLMVLHEDAALRDRLWKRWVQPLLTEPRHDLVGTVLAWQQHQGRTDEVARDLAVHTNTVRNRLSRVEALLGPSRREPQGQAEMWAALRTAGLVQGLAANRTDMLRCPSLAGGTVGFPEFEGQPGRDQDSGNSLAAGDKGEGPRSLPRQVLFRSETETYNRRYQFAVRRGNIFYKSRTAVTGIKEPWAKLSVPACFAGAVTGVSVDDDELIAIDRHRRVYVMDGALRQPSYFSWSMRYGRPFWLGAGRKLPRNRDWEWSVLSILEDGTWVDPAGNDHKVGDNKVSHIWMLTGGGQRLTYMDPWLPPDQSYEACGPERGRFRSQALSTSGSTLFVIGPRGDMFTRLYDFDIAGADPLFFDYAYEDQSKVTSPRIQLPAPDWIEQPKIPGRITDRISIHKVGKRSIRRELRVEGMRAGRTGYWHKDIRKARWHFTRTRAPLAGTRLRNPPRDTSRRQLGRVEDRRYVTRANRARIVLDDFNIYCTPSRMRVRLNSGEAFSLRLHSVDNIRQSERSRGLDNEPRMVRGTIEVPPALRRDASPAAREFLDRIGPAQFTDAPLDVTRRKMKFRNQGWLLRHG